MSKSADCFESTDDANRGGCARGSATGVSPSLAELREGAANVIAAVLVKARGRELTDNNELETALHAASVIVDAVAEYISALAQAERREALEGRQS